jgi:hypothetical protein
MGMRTQWQQFVAMLRFLALRLAVAIRWLCLLAIGAGIGFAVAGYAEGQSLAHLALYGLLPAAVGMIVAGRLTRFGNYVDENDSAA